MSFLKFGLFTIITNHKILCCAGVTARLLFMRTHLYVYLSTLDGVTELRKVLWKSGKTCLSSKIFYRAFVEDQIKILIFGCPHLKLIFILSKRIENTLGIFGFSGMCKNPYFSVPWKPSNT